jgi:hypothetical protein
MNEMHPPAARGPARVDLVCESGGNLWMPGRAFETWDTLGAVMIQSLKPLRRIQGRGGGPEVQVKFVAVDTRRGLPTRIANQMSVPRGEWRWRVLSCSQGIGIGPPLYALLAATAMGMVVSCFRWLLIDAIHSVTGITPPVLNYGALEQRLESFNFIVESHYRYYQFYANALISILFAYGVNRLLKTSSLLGFGTDLGVFILCAVLFTGSRDALSKYRTRSSQLVGHVAEKE